MVWSYIIIHTWAYTCLQSHRAAHALVSTRNKKRGARILYLHVLLWKVKGIKWSCRKVSKKQLRPAAFWRPLTAVTATTGCCIRSQPASELTTCWVNKSGGIGKAGMGTSSRANSETFFILSYRNTTETSCCVLRFARVPLWAKMAEYNRVFCWVKWN